MFMLMTSLAVFESFSFENQRGEPHMLDGGHGQSCAKASD